MKKIALLLIVGFIGLNLNAQRNNSYGSGNIDPNELFEDLIEPYRGGLIRGVSFDWSKSEVLNLENSKSTTSVYRDEEDTELVITTDMGDDILNFADITYTFDEKGLYHIMIESYGTDSKSANQVYDLVVEHFTDKLGEGYYNDDGLLEFYGSMGRSYDYVVAMENLDYIGSPGMEIYIYID